MTEKILKSKFHKQGYWKNETNLEPHLKGKEYVINTISVDDLWASVPKAIIHKGIRFYDSLIQDIEKNGLHNPLLTVVATRKEVLGQKAKWGKKVCDPPFWMADDLDIKMNVVWGGSNRLYAARELGFTHIDCALIPTFSEAMQLQKTHRHTHQHYYGDDYIT
jgi:hypothetical protein